MNRFIKHFFIWGFCFFFSLSAQAAGEPNATTHFQQLQSEMAALKQGLGLARIRQFEDSCRKSRMRSVSDQDEKAHYFDLKNQLTFWGYASGLREALILRYQDTHPDISIKDQEAMSEEANHLAITLIQRIEELRAQYKIQTFPTWHNLLIDMGLKKRGACKHWAQDLLNKITPMPRTYFMTYWGEAHPKTIREHNVAVLVPKDAAFPEGLLVDPWRTAGVPFWIVVKQDHYPWHVWNGYVPGQEVQ